MENLKINQTITDQDIKKVSWRWIMASQITWNYEKMMLAYDIWPQSCRSQLSI